MSVQYWKESLFRQLFSRTNFSSAWNLCFGLMPLNFVCNQFFPLCFYFIVSELLYVIIIFELYSMFVAPERYLFQIYRNGMANGQKEDWTVSVKPCGSNDTVQFWWHSSGSHVQIVHTLPLPLSLSLSIDTAAHSYSCSVAVASDNKKKMNGSMSNRRQKSKKHQGVLLLLLLLRESIAGKMYTHTHTHILARALNRW